MNMAHGITANAETTPMQSASSAVYGFDNEADRRKALGLLKIAPKKR